MPEVSERRRFARFPVVSLSAEYLVMGHLLRRNVLAYKAPPNNEGYDLIAMHPNPRHSGPQLRIQVKSRMATDCDRAFPVKSAALDAFDFLVVAFLNVGFFLSKSARHSVEEGACSPEFYTFTPEFIRQHHRPSATWEKVHLSGLDISPFRNEVGFELVAKALSVPYPSKGSARPVHRADS